MRSIGASRWAGSTRSIAASTPWATRASLGTAHGWRRSSPPARTLLDLAATLTRHQLEAAITEAEINRLGSPTSLAALVARHPKGPGTANLRRILRNSADIGRTITRSDLETAFLAFLDAHGLLRPRTNARIALAGGREPTVDAAWRDQRLIAELDSYGIHTTRRNFEEDRARHRALTVEGWRVVRITWHQLHDRRPTLAAELGALLAQPPTQHSRNRRTGR